MANPLLLILVMICSVILFYAVVAVIFSFYNSKDAPRRGSNRRVKYLAVIFLGIPTDVFLFNFLETDGNLTEAIETALGVMFLMAIFVGWIFLRAKSHQSKPIDIERPTDSTNPVPTNQLHVPSQPIHVPPSDVPPQSNSVWRPDILPLRLLEVYAKKNGMTVVEARLRNINKRFLYPNKERSCRIDSVASNSPLILIIYDSEHGLLTIAESIDGYIVLPRTRSH